MAEESFQERTETATTKRREDARRKGKVARSVDLNSAFMLIFGLLLLFVSGDLLLQGLASATRDYLTKASSFTGDMDAVRQIFLDIVLRTISMLGPVMGGLMIVGLAAGYAQVGPMWSMEAIQPKFSKINPLSGLKRVLGSRRSMVEIGKNVAKATIVGLVAYVALNGIIAQSVTLMDSDPSEIFSSMASASVSVGLKTGLAFLALAVIDFFYQRFEHEKSLKMTKEEVREESKELEGDPLVRGRIRTIQRKIAYKRMMHEVPKADVVVTNPTHLAVALKYDSVKMSAPHVVAKGAGFIAEKIKAIAREHAVPVIEDKPLARALYHSVEIGDEIPEKLFQAVAQVLAYIYRLKSAHPRLGMN
ncbi:MAG TPA: flagellar biosynthesis protein FlhB [Bacteroidota bacterium]|nr:flagellar biosynthesis protein FlhB [Bacteroidota bacterium]